MMMRMEQWWSVIDTENPKYSEKKCVLVPLSLLLIFGEQVRRRNRASASRGRRLTGIALALKDEN